MARLQWRLLLIFTTALLLAPLALAQCSFADTPTCCSDISNTCCWTGAVCVLGGAGGCSLCDPYRCGAHSTCDTCLSDLRYNCCWDSPSQTCYDNAGTNSAVPLTCLWADPSSYSLHCSLDTSCRATNDSCSNCEAGSPPCCYDNLSNKCYSGNGSCIAPFACAALAPQTLTPLAPKAVEAPTPPDAAPAPLPISCSTLVGCSECTNSAPGCCYATNLSTCVPNDNSTSYCLTDTRRCRILDVPSDTPSGTFRQCTTLIGCTTCMGRKSCCYDPIGQTCGPMGTVCDTVCEASPSDFVPSDNSATPNPISVSKSPSNVPTPIYSNVPPPNYSQTCQAGQTRPAPNFQCVNEYVNITSNVTVIGNTTVSNSSIVIGINVTISVSQVLIISGNTTLSFTQGATATTGGLIALSGSIIIVNPTNVTQAPISVSGCVSLAGTLRVNISELNKPTQIKVMDYGCYTGAFSQLQIVGAKDDKCSRMTATPRYTQSSLVVTFMYQNPCETSAIIPGMTDGGAIGLIIAIVIISLALLAAIVLLSVPKLRAKLFPHRDKTNFSPVSGTRSVNL